MIDGAHMQRLLGALPDVLRPSWLEATWSGVHGSAGMAARTEARATITLTGGGISGRSEVAGAVERIRADDGRLVRAGRFLVHQFVGEEAGATAHLDSFALDESARGTGYASELHGQAFTRYAEAGVGSVSLDAIDVGTYAWPRQGYELLGTPPERGRRLAAMVDDARGRYLDDATYAALAPRLVRGDEVGLGSLTSIGEFATVPGAKEYLLRTSSLSLSKTLEPAAPWWAPLGGAAPARDAAAMARRVSAELPPAFRPDGAAAALAPQLDATRGAVLLDTGREVSTTLTLGAGDTFESLTTSVPVRTSAGPASWTLHLGSDGAVRSNPPT
ncbi:MAG: hypothetical protein JWN72_1911 [Thermoleophilia bacterium]|nr:hypothetical protein [Thermoleophilia bacterium]